MSITSTKKNKYLQIFNQAEFPDNPQGIGTFMNQENKPEIALAFMTHRDIITEIGARAYDPECPDDLKICLGVVLDYAKDRSIMSAHMLTPDLIAKALEIDTLSESVYMYAVLAIYVLKDAISNYADLRKEMVADFQNEQVETEHSKN